MIPVARNHLSSPAPSPIDAASLHRVLSLARRMAKRRGPLIDDFEQAAVDGLLAAAETHHKARVGFTAWARACARVKILERCRWLRAGKRDQARAEPLSFDPVAPVDPDEPTFADLVRVLAEADQDLLRLRFVDGLKLDQLADQLGVNECTIRRRISRCLARLKIHHGAA